jgi:hypothetical protein
VNAAVIFNLHSQGKIMRTIILILFTLSSLFTLSAMQVQDKPGAPVKEVRNEKLVTNTVHAFQDAFWLGFVIQRGEPGPVFRRSMNKILDRKLRELKDSEITILNKTKETLSAEELEWVAKFESRMSLEVFFIVIFMDPKK